MKTFDYRGSSAALHVNGSNVRIDWNGQTFTGTVKNNRVQIVPPHPIAVEASAALGPSTTAVVRDVRPEAKVRHDVRKAIGALPGVYLMDNPVGHAEYYDDKTNTIRHVDYGLEEGSPDLIVVLRRLVGCQMIGLELKAPGKSARANQTACHERWRRAGIFVYTVQSGEEALLAIADARRRLSEDEPARPATAVQTLLPIESAL
ncbi:MAG TPA: hypothetical protein PKV97_00075 [Thauera aminoaromatica]|nr:hypothetical protein [Thauera aminoaromatica]